MEQERERKREKLSMFSKNGLKMEKRMATKET